MAYSDIGERGEGLAYLQRQLELSRKLGDRELAALAEHDIAINHLKGEDKLTLLKKALAEFEALANSTLAAIALYNIGNHHYEQKSYSGALSHAEKALAIIPATMFDLQVMLFRLRAACYVKLQDEMRAQATLQQMMELAHSKVPQLLGNCHLVFGEFHSTFKRYPEAIRTLEGAIAAGLHHASQNLKAHKLLAECYGEMGDYTQAYQQQLRFQDLHEKVFHEESERKVRALEVIYRTRTAQRETELERERSAELREHIVQLERLNTQIRELSIRDSLTGLYNRRYFTEQLSELFTHAQEKDLGLGLVLLDIDYFKTINDTFGHSAGDAVLVGVASLLTAEVRISDIVARLGGEEFAILLPQHDLETTVGIAERIRSVVAAQRWTPLNDSTRVTISLGVAISAGCPDAETFLLRADAWLYEAKRQGRNRVCV